MNFWPIGEILPGMSNDVVVGNLLVKIWHIITRPMQDCE